MSNRQIDLTRPSLPALLKILRDQSFWPEGFEWNYSKHCSCAMGLMSRLWGNNGKDFTAASAAALLEVKDKRFYGPLICAGEMLNKRHCDITPEEIADLLELAASRL